MGRTLSKLVVTAAALAMSASASACAAQAAAETGPTAAPTPGWRIVSSYPAGTEINAVAVSGPDSAWAYAVRGPLQRHDLDDGALAWLRGHPGCGPVRE
jgi:hypothetical protein